MRRALVAAALLVAGQAQADQRERVEISAPLLPYYLGAPSQIEGSSYPSDPQARIDYVRNYTYSFEELLALCAPQYPGIGVQQPGDPPLTQAQLVNNYDLVAQCSYEKYVVKPYWIPQLVDDVDVCAVKLGSGWRMLTEHDLATLDEADFQYIQDTVSGVNASGSFWGAFYFSLHTYVRGDDGTLKMGDLTPGVATRVSALAYPSWGGPTFHYEGDLAPRCIRRNAVVAP